MKSRWLHLLVLTTGGSRKIAICGLRDDGRAFPVDDGNLSCTDVAVAGVSTR
jgi:hypothetical protein